MNYEDAYGFSPELLDLINRGRENQFVDEDVDTEVAPDEEEPEVDNDYDELQKKYDDLQSERDALQTQIDAFSYSDNPEIQNDFITGYNAVDEGNSSVLNMVMRDDEADTDVSWLPKKSKEVNIAGLDPKLRSYLNTLPDELKDELLVTSANDQKHEKNSRHYRNKAVDLRYIPKVHDFIAKDPIAKKYGINVLDPNHGTAPHTHISIKQYGGKYKI